MSFADIINTRKLEMAQEVTGDGIHLHLAAAVLMYDVMISDGLIDEMEVANMVEILRNRYALSAEEISEMIRMAREIVEDKHSRQLFATQLRNSLAHDEREQLLNDFWSLASADWLIKDNERDAIAKIGHYLALSDEEIQRARFRAETKLELHSV